MVLPGDPQGRMRGGEERVALWERVSEERGAVEEGWVPEKVGGDAQGEGCRRRRGRGRA